MVQAKIFIGVSVRNHTYFHRVCWFLPILPNPANRCAASVCSPSGVLAFETEIVSDHGDKLRIRGLALDAAHGVAEELLQGLHVAAVPGDLDGIRASALLGRGWPL